MKINLKVSIHSTLGQVHPDLQITLDAIQSVENFLIHLAQRLIELSIQISSRAGELTSVRHIDSAVRRLLPGELAKHAVSEGTKAYTKYSQYHPLGDDPEEISRQKIRNSGLVFDVRRVQRFFPQNESLSIEGQSVWLAAVLEYLSAEIMELSGNICRKNNRKVILFGDIREAELNDEEFPIVELSLKGSSLPVSKLEWGEVTVQGEKFKDAIVFSKAIEWDWRDFDLHHDPGYTESVIAEIRKFVDSLSEFSTTKPRIFLSIGMQSCIQVPEDSKGSNGDLIFLQSEECVKEYHSSIQKGEPSILFLHSTC